MTETPEASAFFNAASDTLSYLYDRWQDEREYEDLADYAIPLRKIAEKHGVQILGMTRRPFGVKFVVKDRTFAMTANRRDVGYKRIS